MERKERAVWQLGIGAKVGKHEAKIPGVRGKESGTANRWQRGAPDSRRGSGSEEEKQESVMRSHAEATGRTSPRETGHLVLRNQ